MRYFKKNNITVAVTQMVCTWNSAENIDKAEFLVRSAAQQGANIILLPELFETPYFCKDRNPDFFDLAKSFEDNPLLNHFAQLAAELRVVLPISFFEKANNAYYNSVAIIDADGSQLGIYRKTYIPNGEGYYEKYYFNQGNTGFKVWQTQYAKIGVGICWDQWFPEAARAMAVQGAELLLYPSAIGSEPIDSKIDSRDHWQRVMQGHAAANIMPVLASNRVGTELGKSCELSFYGSSFITDHTGKILCSAGRDEESFLLQDFDMEKIRKFRDFWGVFDDCKPNDKNVEPTIRNKEAKIL